MNERRILKASKKELQVTLQNIPQRLLSEKIYDNYPFDEATDVGEVEYFIKELQKTPILLKTPEFFRDEVRIYTLGAAAVSEATSAQLKGDAINLISESVELFRDSLKPAQKYNSRLHEMTWFAINVLTKKQEYDTIENIIKPFLNKEEEVHEGSLAKLFKIALANYAPDGPEDGRIDLINQVLNHSLDSKGRFSLAIENTVNENIAKSVNILYQDDPETVTRKCESMGLYLELIEAMIESGDTPPSRYFGALISKINAGELKDLTRVTKVCVSCGKNAIIDRIEKRLPLDKKERFRGNLARLRVEKYIEEKDFENAYNIINSFDFENVYAKNSLEAYFRRHLKLTDVETFLKYTKPSDHSKNYLEYTLPLCLKEDDLEKAEKLVKTEYRKNRAYGWVQLAAAIVKETLAAGNLPDIGKVIGYFERSIKMSKRPEIIRFASQGIHSQLLEEGYKQEADVVYDFATNQLDESDLFSFKYSAELSRMRYAARNGDHEAAWPIVNQQEKSSIREPDVTVTMLVTSGIIKAMYRRNNEKTN